MIKFNKARCLMCNDIIESLHRHDFVTCICGNLSVDGGRDYLKRSVMNMGYYEELSCRPDCFLGDENTDCAGCEYAGELEEFCKNCDWLEANNETVQDTKE